MKILFLFFLFISISFILKGQDTTVYKNKIKNKIEFDIETGWYYQYALKKQNQIYTEVIMPSALLPRRRNDPEIQNSWGLLNNEATDNPLYHGAFYLDLKSKIRIAKGLILTGDFIGEHRGLSSGTYDLSSIVIYPQIHVDYLDTFNIGSKKFSTSLIAGNLNNIRILEGLTFYNIDVIGQKATIQYQNFKFQYNHIADLLFGPGLNINDAFVFVISAEDTKLSKKFFSNIQLGYTLNTPNPNLYPYTPINRNSYDLSLSTTYKKKIQLYTQFSLRDKKVAGLSNYFAAVAGSKYKQKFKSLTIDALFEYRYYGAGYNRYFINEKVYFRQKFGQYPFNFANTVGRQLYPLRHYDRSFSQWAVYTEYQGSSINAIVLNLEAKYQIYKNISILGNLDLNTIQINTTNNFTYPFYGLGLFLKINKNTQAVFMLNNKGMNLDKHYSTYYLYKQPAFNFSFNKFIN